MTLIEDSNVVAIDSRRSRGGLSYVLPLYWDADHGLAELVDYLRMLLASGSIAEAIVVDGSPAARFAVHAEAFGGVARHLAAHEDLRFVYGKVNNVITGVREAGCEHVVLADDDVRYTPATLARLGGALESAELVIPQNHFDPLPWHARWDTARTLLNRAFGGDYPGTLALRRSHFLAMGGYDGDVLFENLELIRTVRASGGRVARRSDLYVKRLPPIASHFRSQRVRQAYDDFALPLRMLGWLSIAPAAALLARARRGDLLLRGAAGSLLAAEIGRRRAGGRGVFGPSSALWAPLWLAERSVCAWLALGNRLLRGGQPYGRMRIARAATPQRVLRRRYRERFGAAGSPRPSTEDSLR